MFLLQEPDLHADEEYGLVDNMIILKGRFDLSLESSEEDIRSELVNLFKTKLPGITAKDFVRRDRNTISVQVVKDTHKWDFKHVKHLCGTGRLSVCLNVDQQSLILTEEDDNSDPEVPYSDATTSITSASREVIGESDQNIELATDVALGEEMAKEVPDEEVHQILNRLKLSMKPYMHSEKLKVDEEDLIDGFFLHYYKSPEFDPSIAVKVRMKGESAGDTGGVLRQTFTDVFTQIASGVPCMHLFRGSDSRLTPICSTEHVLTGVFEVLGKMIAHSLIQGGPVFLFLNPSIYWYIATGDLSEAVARSFFVDVRDHKLACFVERISLNTQSCTEECGLAQTLKHLVIPNVLYIGYK